MNGDPIGSDAPRGKSCEKRMGRYDGSFTPSEQRLKNQLMKQFTRYGEGVGGNTKAYRDGYDRIDWSDGSNAAWAKHDSEVADVMRELNEWRESLVPSERRVFAANYDAIDWSK